MSCSRRQSRNPFFVSKKTVLAIAAGMALSSQISPVDAATYVVNTLVPADPGGFLEALDNANANPASDVISFQSGLNGTITLPDGVDILHPVSITGPGRDIITITTSCASSCGDLFEITASGQVTISGLTLDSANPDFNQSLIEHNNSGALTISDCALFNSGLRTTSGNGGAINNTMGNLTIQNITIRDQNAAGNGGAIALTGANNFVMQNATIRQNSADSGGGIYLELSGTDQTNVQISTSSIASNEATADIGGGLAAVTVGTDAQLNMTLASSSFFVNEALRAGGGLAVTGDSLTQLDIDSNSIVSNRVDAALEGKGGGGLYMSGDAMTLGVINTTIVSNRVMSGTTIPDGGGVYLDSDTTAFVAEFLHVTIIRNLALSGTGGGIATGYSAGSMTIVNSVVAENIAMYEEDISSVQTQFNYSLIGDSDGANIGSSTGSIIGTFGNRADPELSNTQTDNGGTGIGDGGVGYLLTGLVLAGSPVIGAASPAATGSNLSMPATELRGIGFNRIRGGRPEMGALEYIPPSNNNGGGDTGGGGGGGATDSALLLSLLSLLGLRRRRD